MVIVIDVYFFVTQERSQLKNKVLAMTVRI